MGLGENTIGHWDTMRKISLKKYQDYCIPRDSKEDIFRMDQLEDENLEDCLEKVLYNLQLKHSSLNFEIIHTIFLKGILANILILLISRDLVTFEIYHLNKLLKCVGNTLGVDLRMEKDREIPFSKSLNQRQGV